MKILTNSDVKKPYDCLAREFLVLYGLVLPAVDLSSSFCSSGFLKPGCCSPADAVDARFPMASETLEALPKEPNEPTEPKKQAVRSFFPETWIWDLVSVG